MQPVLVASNWMQWLCDEKFIAVRSPQNHTTFSAYQYTSYSFSHPHTAQVLLALAVERICYTLVWLFPAHFQHFALNTSLRRIGKGRASDECLGAR